VANAVLLSSVACVPLDGLEITASIPQKDIDAQILMLAAAITVIAMKRLELAPVHRITTD